MKTKDLKNGDHFRLLSKLEDPYSPKSIGTKGTVTKANSPKDSPVVQVEVTWETGGSLMLLEDDDVELVFEVRL